MDDRAKANRRDPMHVADFDYRLPESLIAQHPPLARGASRLLVLDRGDGSIRHRHIGDLPDLLPAGSLLVVNDTRVFPARLLGRRVPSGGAVELLLMSRLDEDRWDVLVHPGQKLGPGARVTFEGAGRRLDAEILERRFHGRRVVRLGSPDGTDVSDVIDAIGHIPLPPYIRRADTPADRERYQTVYGRTPGSVAAPTAGLHFTEALLSALDARGTSRVAITLHVGYGTFKPVRAERVEDHVVDPEPFVISPDTASAINRARSDRRPIVAVGTTTVRALESAAGEDGRVAPGSAVADLFIYPGHRFRIVDRLITNFHLPRSSLLMLVSAFGGREHVLRAYASAVEEHYRFYSYGDAMVIG